MIVLGIILIILGLILPASSRPSLSRICWWSSGSSCSSSASILAVLGSTGRAVGGRRHYY